MTKLTMHASMCSSSGLNAEYMAGPVFRYKVDGMPPRGPETFIVNVNSGTPHEALWSIARGRDRTGEYKTAEDALVALQQEIDEVSVAQ